jgi:hypothetical protein
MHAFKRHVLIVDKRPVVRNVLQELSEGVESDDSVPHGIRRGLEEFAKHGGVRVILDLQVVGPSFEGSSAAIRNITAFVVGEVLIITGQVTSRRMLRILQIKAESRWHFFHKRLIIWTGAFISTAVVDVEFAVQRIARPIRRAVGILGRAPAR